MSEFKLERGVPIPKGLRGDGRRYPWDDMEPGDSFVVTCPDGQSLATVRNRVSGCAYRAARRRGMVAVVRAEREGFRVWFTAPETNHDT